VIQLHNWGLYEKGCQNAEVSPRYVCWLAPLKILKIFKIEKRPLLGGLDLAGSWKSQSLSLEGFKSPAVTREPNLATGRGTQPGST
jgi:hypothetical protein